MSNKNCTQKSYTGSVLPRYLGLCKNPATTVSSCSWFCIGVSLPTTVLLVMDAPANSHEISEDHDVVADTFSRAFIVAFALHLQFAWIHCFFFPNDLRCYDCSDWCDANGFHPQAYCCHWYQCLVDDLLGKRIHPFSIQRLSSHISATSSTPDVSPLS